MGDKKIFQTLAFLFVLYGLLYTVEQLYKGGIKKMNDKPLWVQHFNNENFDFVISGSSRAENNVDVNTIETHTGLKGLNIAYSGSAFAENYLALTTFFDSGNKAKYVLLNADVWSVIDQKKAYSYPFHGYYYFNQLGNDTVDKVMKENYGSVKVYIWKYLPFVKYGEYNNIFNPVKFYTSEIPKPESFSNNKGTDLLSKTNNLDVPELKEDFEPDNYSICNLKRIINLCKKNNTELILFHSPDMKSIRQRNKAHNEEACINLLLSIAKESQIEYWDYSSLEEITGRTEYFYNATHLNAEGARKFSTILAENLIKSIN